MAPDGSQAGKPVLPDGSQAGKPVLPLAHEPLTIAAGLSVAQGIEESAGVTCSLKWPNDVLIDGAKVAGILVEVRRQGGGRCIVIGIGINANASPPSSRVDSPATDLASHTGEEVDRVQVVRAVLRRLDYWCIQLARGDLSELHEQWMARCGMINQRVELLSGGRSLAGRVLDIDPLRGLILTDDSGNTFHLPAETSTLVK